jgi:hypothetical protein
MGIVDAADAEENCRPAKMPQFPIDEASIPRGERHIGICTGFNAVDLWGRVRVRGTEIEATFTMRDVRDGDGPLKAGDKASFSIGAGQLGWVAREVERE